MCTVKMKGCFVILLIGSALITYQLMSSSGNQLRTLNGLCSTSQLLPRHAGERTLLSLNFSGIEEYLDKLFLPCRITEIPEVPALLTAFSSKDFKEGLILLDHLNQTVRRWYPDLELYFFDLGLAEKQAKQVRAMCRCNFRMFPFDGFPTHVHDLKSYAWKPIAIQMILREHPFVVWIDTSIRFTTADFGGIINRAKLEGVLAGRRSNLLLRHTAKPTFEMLKTDPWSYNGKAIFGAAFVVIRATPYVVQYIQRPWISCALQLGCMVPAKLADKLRNCLTPGTIYFKCHRFDESVLSILIHMAYREKEVKHEVCDKAKKHCVIQCPWCTGLDVLEKNKTSL